MKDKQLYDILKTYAEKLGDKFGGKNLDIDIIHNDTDLVIRCWEREILYSILKYHNKNYKIGGFYKESLLGKVIIFSIEDIKLIYKTLEFDDIYKYYKEEFIKRINKIIKKYDIFPNLVLDNTYLLLKKDYNECIKNEDINIDLYYQIRERFEGLRDNIN